MTKNQSEFSKSPQFDNSSLKEKELKSESPPGDKPKKLLSTSSPEGIQVASKITPTRLANLLIRKGPLPIRHITHQLSEEVPNFDKLSLSKQRRLIMSAMEQTDTTNNVVFEKIGWGQWAVRKVDSDFIVTEGTDTSDEANKKQINVNDLRTQGNLKLGWSKKKSVLGSSRRESITNNKTNLHNLKLPNEGFNNDSNAIVSDSEDEYDLSDNIQVDSDEEDDDDDDDDDDIEDDEEVELFSFDNDEMLGKFKRSPPIKFANRVPIKVSPPPIGTNPRRRSSASQPNSISKIANPNHRHQIFNRSRLNLLENLENYIISSAKNSNVSINSPPPPSAAASALSGSPINSWNSNYIHQPLTTSPDGLTTTISAFDRRKSSFNESHIRSTLSSSLPKVQSKPELTYQSGQPLLSKISNEILSDTDEEDWATMGAATLRKRENDHTNLARSKADEDERSAATALVDMINLNHMRSIPSSSHH